MRLIVIFLAVLTLIGCTSAENDTVETSITYGLTLSPSGFDPHRNSSSEIGIVLRQIYDTLVYRDPTSGEIIPGLASSWTLSENKLTYTFTLRQDVKFHDGTPFNAQAVAANLDRITNPDTQSQKAIYMLGPIQSYQVINDYTVQITLSEPYSPLLDSFAQIYLGIASPKALNDYTIDTYQYHQVGTGPYVFVDDSFLPGEKVVLRRNPDYAWGPTFYQTANEAAPDEIVYRFFTDPATRTVALESGDVQIVGEVLPTMGRSLTGNSNLRLLPIEIPGQPLQFMINVDNYPTNNIAVRQALIHGTNRSTIVDTIFQGFSPVAWGPISAATLYYSPSIAGRYEYNIQQATALLSANGLTDADNNGYIDNGEDDLEITIVYAPWGMQSEVAQLLQDQWREIGIKVNLQPVPGFSALLEAAAANEYHLIAINSFGYDPSFLNQYFLSNGVNNFSRYSNPELDNALIVATRESDSALRASTYEQIQNFIMDQALILPIRDYVNLNATSASIETLDFDIYGWFPLMQNAVVAEK